MEDGLSHCNARIDTLSQTVARLEGKLENGINSRVSDQHERLERLEGIMREDVQAMNTKISKLSEKIAAWGGGLCVINIVIGILLVILK